jgi:hypothetical protein
MNNNCKQYTLDDGSVTDAKLVAKAVGISIKNARVRLSSYSDPSRVFKAKQERSSEGDLVSCKERRALSRGMGDAMLVLALKTI